MLLLAVLSILLGHRQARIGTGLGDGPLIDRFDFLGPLLHLGVISILLFELIPNTQQMHSTALMQALIAVVGGVEIRAEHSVKAFAQKFQAIEVTNDGQHMRRVGALEAPFFNPSSLTQALDQPIKEALSCFKASKRARNSVNTEKSKPGSVRSSPNRYSNRCTLETPPPLADP
jgi:hypothetical protein